MSDKSEALKAVEACENGDATPLQQKCVAKYFRDAWFHEGQNAERLAKTDHYGLALMMVQNGCANPARVAGEALEKSICRGCEQSELDKNHVPIKCGKGHKVGKTKCKDYDIHP